MPTNFLTNRNENRSCQPTWVYGLAYDMSEINVIPVKFPADLGQNSAGCRFHADFRKDSGSRVAN
ncbi:hypothetical protein MTR_4g015215 [Medicago truncatula]|uniref:Uncharacterized protein n=1 Tax=Medicago truncatula TaxID=3880 RepID=A0A072USN8_MEDTR|nr:hypothetical protein MTR_4g015215 [Medicago truncatula]